MGLLYSGHALKEGMFYRSTALGKEMKKEHSQPYNLNQQLCQGTASRTWWEAVRGAI